MTTPAPGRISINTLVDEMETEAGSDHTGVPIDTLVIECLENAVECNLCEHFTEDDVLLLTVRPRLADEVRGYVREVLNA